MRFFSYYNLYYKQLQYDSCEIISLYLAKMQKIIFPFYHILSLVRDFFDANV